MKTGLIIQARKGSTRLPNKMVLPFFNGKGVLELLIEKLLQQFPKEQIVLATTTNAHDDELEAISKKKQINCYRGSETNVLQRFVKAAEAFGTEYIIRICADNPFLDIPHIHDLISEIEKGDFDYVSYKTENGLPTIKSHLGLFTEAVSLAALKKVAQYTNEVFYQEHVTNFIYENPIHFKIKLLELPEYMDDTETIRLTLDTKEDFKLYQELFFSFQNKNTKSTIDFIKRDKNLKERMTREINRHTK